MIFIQNPPLTLSLEAISLFQFKNYFQQDFQFPQKVTGITGRNGLGKTNLLDAVYYLCFTKSYFARMDSVNVMKGHQGFRIEGSLNLGGEPESAVCILRENGRKEFLMNGAPYDRFSAHIGRYPCVMIAPDDVQLIIGGGEDRRRFMDTLLSQLDPEYLQHLIRYTRLLQQRNSFLRGYAGGFGGRDLGVLDVLDEQLARSGDEIHRVRRDFLFRFLPTVRHLYEGIARQHEEVTLIYESELHERNLGALLQGNRPRDLSLQRTSSGIHRDDLRFTMQGQPFRSMASQGQRKSLLFALKLAELETLRTERRTDPFLLLDDVFEKLDEDRISALLLQVCRDNAGQVWITDTNTARLRAHLDTIGTPYDTIEL